MPSYKEIEDFAYLYADCIYVRAKIEGKWKTVSLDTLPMEEIKKHCFDWYERQVFPHNTRQRGLNKDGKT